jgi:hypothetical protein
MDEAEAVKCVDLFSNSKYLTFLTPTSAELASVRNGRGWTVKCVDLFSNTKNQTIMTTTSSELASVRIRRG